MAKKKKTWKDSLCSECDFCVNRRCRKTRPPDGFYPVVTVVGNAGRDSPACSEFKKRT